MKLDDFCTKELDSQFKQIPGLKYLPWIGCQTIKRSDNLLIIGESVYNWEKDVTKRETAQARIEKDDFARVVIYEHGIESPHPKRKFARNIEKTLAPEFETDSERIDFWENIIFHELVQRPMANSKARPDKEDYKLGAEVLTAIIKIVKPQKCLFLGTTWSKFTHLRNSLNLNKNHAATEVLGFGKINGAKPKILKINELNCTIYFIKHPSSYFTPDLWKNFIEEN